MSRRARIFFWGIFIAVLAWSVFVRCWRLNERPFWTDEAWVASAVTDLSYRELLSQTELHVPTLFMVSTKLIGSFISPPELGFRLLPLLCGILCVPLAYLTARALRLPAVTALVGMALCASSPLLVIWSRELKQYEIEAFLSVLLALLVFRLRRFPKVRGASIATAGIILICLLGLWFGYGSVFATAALMGVLILIPPVSGSRRRMVITGLAGLAAMTVSFVFAWYFTLAAKASHKALLNFMKPWFIDVTSLKSWLRAATYGLSSSVELILPFYKCVTNLMLIGVLGVTIWVLIGLGLWNWPRKTRLEMTCWVIGPWILLLGAAVAQKYPFGVQRIMVFVAVPMVLALGMGLVTVFRFYTTLVTGRGGWGIVLALVIALLPVCYMYAVPVRGKFRVQQDFPALLRILQQQRKEDQLVFVTLEAMPSVKYYAGDYGKDFIFVPATSGVVPVPGYDYNKLARDALRRAGGQWWMLTTNFERDLRRQELMRMARMRGYEFELAAEAGGEKVWGVAQLYSVSKNTTR